MMYIILYNNIHFIFLIFFKYQVIYYIIYFFHFFIKIYKFIFTFLLFYLKILSYLLLEFLYKYIEKKNIINGFWLAILSNQVQSNPNPNLKKLD